MHNSPNFQVDALILKSCNPAITNTALLGSGATSFVITPAHIDSVVGHPYLTKHDSIIIEVLFHPLCQLGPYFTLPDMELLYHNYCDSVDTLFIYVPFDTASLGTNCSDCFVVTKTATPANVVENIEPVYYTITVCSNNNSNSTATVDVSDTYPTGYIPINDPFMGSTIPVTLTGADCHTINASGFLSGDSCNSADISLNGNILDTAIACVTLLSNCALISKFIIPDSTYISAIQNDSAFKHADTYDVQGRLYINNNASFAGKTFYMEPAAEIIVQPKVLLQIKFSTIRACSKMWKSITLLSHNDNAASLYMDSCYVHDGQYAIYLNDFTSAKINRSVFERNFVSIYAPQSPIDANSIALNVTGCIFQSGAGLETEYFGQTPQLANKSFAGIWLHDMPFTINNIGNTPTLFNDMSNGIIGSRVDMNLTNCLYKNIIAVPGYNALAAFNGSAIYGNGGRGYAYIKQYGFGKYSTIPTFDNCDYAITGSRINIHSYSNKMINMNRAYRIDFSSNRNIEILNNYIVSKRNAIDLRFNDNAQHILIKDNEIHFGDPLSNGLVSNTAISVVEQGGYNQSSIITRNKIYYNPYSRNAVNGIQIYTAKNWQVTVNSLFMNDNANNTYGILATGCDSVVINCNSVKGSFDNYNNQFQSGIKSIMGNSPELSCNNTDGMFNGIYFTGVAFGSILRGNNFGQHVNGLILDNTAIIGTQKHKGNLWFSPSISASGFNAIYKNPVNAFLYKFIIDTTIIIAGNPKPFNSTPSGWFNISSGANWTCNNSTDTFCIKYGGSSQVATSLDYQIAQGQLQNNPYTDESRWMLRGDLYEKLKNNPSLLMNDTVLSNFYNTIQNQLEAQFRDINSESSNLFNLNSLVQDNLNHNKDLLEQLMIQLTDLTKQMLTDSIDTLQLLIFQNSINSLHQQMSILLNYNRNVLTLAENTRILNADNSRQTNDFIITSRQVEENQQTVNEVYFSTIAQSSFAYSSSQWDALILVALQCPLLGGNAVFKARAMLMMVDDEINYDDVNTCLQSGIVLREQQVLVKSTTASSSIYIVPNPAKQKATLFYQLPENGKGNFILYDMFGKILYEKNLIAGSTNIELDLDRLANGLYLFKVFANKIEMGNGKLVVIK